MLEPLLEQLRRTHDGDPWYGPSRTRLLAGLTPAEAASHPVPGAHSVWELVLHMTAWTNEVRRRLDGRPASEPPEGDWPPVGKETEATWAEALAGLDRAHAALAQAAAGLSPAQLGRDVVDGRDPPAESKVTVAGTLVGLVQHDAYHTGQLAILRRAIEAGRAR